MLEQQQLQEVYEMVDAIPLSRPKRNINRDFADGVMMAEVIQHYSPKLVSLHNYPPGNSLSKKVNNWNMLNQKVFKRIGIAVSSGLIKDIANATPNAVELLLHQVLLRFEKPDQEGSLVQNATYIQTQPHPPPTPQPSANYNSADVQSSPPPAEQARWGAEEGEKIEEIADWLQRIDHGYIQLKKLNELNKVKEETIKNLEKKLQKFIYT